VGTNFVECLRQLDQELQRHELSPAADARLREAIFEGQRERQRGRSHLVWIPVGALAAACAVLLVLWRVLWSGPGPVTGTPAPRSVGGFSVLAGTSRLHEERQVRCHSDRCALEVPGVQARLELAGRATVRRRRRDVELIRGKVTCEVKPVRTRGAPFVVYVSHGEIRVLGTRFTLWQDEGGGRVELHRGAIAFRSRDGREVTLRPGEELRWPLPPPVPAPAVKVKAPGADAGRNRPAVRPKRKNRPITVDEAESLLDQIGRLRSQGRFGEAVRRLRRSLPRVTDRVARERLSYELGTILTHHLRDAGAACRHWKRHLRAFGPRRYGVEINKLRQQLGCTP
jgi:hypothetical protein